MGVGGGRCSHILVSPDGKTVYAATRTDGKIAQFTVGDDGTLTKLGSDVRPEAKTCTFHT